MPSGHKPKSHCEMFHVILSKFSDAVPFQMIDASGEVVLFSDLKQHANGCKLHSALGMDHVCSCWSHDQRFQLLDDQTQAPLKNRLYKIYVSGEVSEGRTDDNGMTEKVSDDLASIAKIEIFPEGA